MSIGLYSGDGILGSLGTATEATKISALVPKFNAPELVSLFQRGFTQKPNTAADEINDILASKDVSASTKSWLRNLQRLLKKAEEIAIIHS